MNPALLINFIKFIVQSYSFVLSNISWLKRSCRICDAAVISTGSGIGEFSLYFNFFLLLFLHLVKKRVYRKIHWLTNILSWNMTKWDLLFNELPLQSTHFFHRCCSAWVPLARKFPTTNMTSSYELFSQWTFCPLSYVSS